MINRVDYELLDYDFEKGIATLDELPFSGLAFERRKDGGLDEVIMLGGVKHGLTRTWFASGAIMCEENFYKGSLHGVCWEWFENGHLKSEAIFEFGVRVKAIIWDEAGTVVSDYDVNEDEFNFRMLSLRRRTFRTNFDKRE
jgi:hypothetical protein